MSACEDYLGPEQDVDEYLFRWGPPSPLEGGRTYPRWSLLGVSNREVIADGPRGPWRVRWSFRPWKEDADGNPVPPPDYIPGHPGRLGKSRCGAWCTREHSR
jgi:hypothetical protein